MPTQESRLESISVYDSPWRYAEKNDGLRCPEMDMVTEFERERLVPLGWVVDGKLSREKFWDMISHRAFVIPLKPSSGILPGAIKARRQLRKTKEKYGQDLSMMMIADDESFGGWTFCPVKLSDLAEEYQAKPSTLLSESLELERQGDYLASDMKCHAYMLLTGMADTK